MERSEPNNAALSRPPVQGDIYPHGPRPLLGWRRETSPKSMVADSNSASTCATAALRPTQVGGDWRGSLHRPVWTLSRSGIASSSQLKFSFLVGLSLEGKDRPIVLDSAPWHYKPLLPFEAEKDSCGSTLFPSSPENAIRALSLSSIWSNPDSLTPLKTRLNPLGSRWQADWNAATGEPERAGHNG